MTKIQEVDTIKSIFVVFLVTLLGNFVGAGVTSAASDDWRSWPRLPNKIYIVPPGPGVPENVAKLSGVWHGGLDNCQGILVTIVIEEITAYGVKAIYSSSVEGGPGWIKVEGLIENDKIVLRWTSRSKFGAGDRKLTLQLMGNEAFVEYERWSYYCKAFMTRKQFPTDANISSADPSLPSLSNANISSPDPSVPSQISAFLGIWEGSWDNLLRSRIAVEKINAFEATGVYAWADYPQGSKGGSTRYTAKVDPTGSIVFISPTGSKFTFTLSKDLIVLEGKVEFQSGRMSNATMRKIVNQETQTR